MMYSGTVILCGIMINIPQHEIRVKKCLDTCQLKTKFVSILKKTNLTVKIDTITLNFGSDTCQINIQIVQVISKSA